MKKASERMKMTTDEILEEINQLIREYDFPIKVLYDVHRRLVDCNDPYYAKLQLNYLQNFVKVGYVVKRKGK